MAETNWLIFTNKGKITWIRTYFLAKPSSGECSNICSYSVSLFYRSKSLQLHLHKCLKRKASENRNEIIYSRLIRRIWMIVNVVRGSILYERHQWNMMILRIMHWPRGARRSSGGQDGRCVHIVWTDGVKRREQGKKPSRPTPLKVNAWNGNVA